MVVDDEEPIRTMLGKFLQACGFRVLLAATGNDALRICVRFGRRIGLMITDVQMPELSGFELAKQINQIVPELPVLFMSGGFLRRDHEIQERTGPHTEFVEKPFTHRSLLSKIESLMAVRSNSPGHPLYGRN